VTQTLALDRDLGLHVPIENAELMFGVDAGPILNI
jgi:hypothetical protein